jgi:hypothetical protein
MNIPFLLFCGTELIVCARVDVFDFEVHQFDGSESCARGRCLVNVWQALASTNARARAKSRRIRISSIPSSLLEQLKPLLKDKDLKIILPIGQKPTENLKQLGETATTKAKIYVDFHGKEANTGSIYFSDTIYNIVWLQDKILNISTMEYGKCVKCMMGTFEGGWRYSQKW